MLVGLCSSRFGLWAFDLALSQIMQETVAADQVGVINGTADSLMDFMFLCSFLLTTIFPDPAKFMWPVLVSFGSVATAALLFTRYAIPLLL
jgi:iron-regulated transporter 1